MVQELSCINCGHPRASHVATIQHPEPRERPLRGFVTVLSDCPGFETDDPDALTQEDLDRELQDEQEALDDRRPRSRSTSHWDQG